MADGQDLLNQLQAAPVNPVQQIPSAPNTAMLPQATAADVMAGIQAAQNAPAPDNIMPQDAMTGTLDLPAQAAPNVTQHMGWLHRILDTVGTILGGDQTLHIKKDTDGNVTITHDPSTTGEKWGRIAQAALGGAAQGLAQSQGPGGLARAAAAGTQYGLQLPQQRQQQVQQEATAEQQIQLRNAQNAMLHQNLLTAEFQNKMAPIELRRRYAQEDVNFGSTIMDNGGHDWGTIHNEQDMLALTRAHPELIQNHMGQAGNNVIMIPEPDGGTHIYTLPTGQGAQRIIKPIQLPDRLILTGDGTTYKTVPGEFAQPGMKMNDFFTAVQGRYDANNKVLSGIATAKSRQEGAARPRSQVVMTNQGPMWAYEPTTDEPQGRLVPMNRPGGPTVTGKMGTIRPDEGAALTPEQVGHWTDLLSDPHANMTMAQVPRNARQAVADDMAAKGVRPTHPLTTAELNRMDLATNTLGNIAEAQRLLEAHPEMFGPAGFGKTKFQDLFEGGNEYANAFRTAITLANLPAVGIHGVKGKYAVEDLGNLNSDLYKNPASMRAILNEITRSANEFAQSGGRVTTPRRTAAAPETTPPTTTSGTPTARAGTTQQQQQNPPRQHTEADVPRGATPGRDNNGNIVGYQDAQGWHAF